MAAKTKRVCGHKRKPMSKINNNHILAAALALVEAKLQEALADLSHPDVNADDIVKLVETVVDRKLGETPSFDNLTENMTNAFHQRIESAGYQQRAYSDEMGMRLGKSTDALKTALEAHNHDDAYSALGHDHDASYAPLNAFNEHNHDGEYTKHETTKALSDKLNTTIKAVVEATTKDLDDIHAKIDHAMVDPHNHYQPQIDVVHSRLDKQESRATELESFVGKAASAHGELRNEVQVHKHHQKAVIEKIKTKISDLNAKKSDVHDHPYAPIDHSHGEFATVDDLESVQDRVNQIDQTFSTEVGNIFSRMDQLLAEKQDQHSAITKDDLATLKSEVLQAAKDSIVPPKDALNWEFKQHPSRQGTLMYKRDDWSHWKTMMLFNDNTMKELMNAVNRVTTPPRDVGGFGMAGPAYQDPREIISHGSLNDLMDVDTNSVRPTSNDVFMWDALSNQWVPRTVQEFAAVIIPILENDMNKQYNKLVDVIDPQNMYVGESIPGTATTAAGWRIKKITEDVSGDMTILWANGSADFTQIWDNRTTLNYSI
jgi:hypothetical protein